jgi:tetratricopeptide (TPR) repeat protein/predicted nucleic acid-binding Zn ribbon protein
MECPECGFSQPDELFCARCGVNISKALKRRKKRLILTFASMAVILGFGVASVLLWLRPWERLGTPKALETQEQRDSIPKVTPSPPPPPVSHEASKKQLTKKKAKSSQSREPQMAEKPTTGGAQEEQTQAQEPSDPQVELLRWAAQEWMEKAKEAEGDPVRQAEMYNRALEVYPEFAPAHYHLGIIQLKEGKKELAKEHFRKFISHAKPQERDAFPLPAEVAQELSQ